MQVRCKKCLDIIYTPPVGDITQVCRCENIIVIATEDKFEIGWINGKSADNLEMIDDDGMVYTLDQFKRLKEAGEA